MEICFKDQTIYNPDAAVPSGGSVGQVLTKVSNENYETQWEDISETFIVKAPIGTIVIWSGSQDNIPTGWALCDGQDGRPDLRDKFVLGAGETHSVGETGGVEEVTLTVSQMPKHLHIEKIAGSDSSSTSNIVFGGGDDGATGRAILDSAQTLIKGTLTSTGYSGSSYPHPNMPPYYTLCYIIKVTADETDGGSSYTAGDGLTLDDDTFSVITPVRGIYTLDQWNALSEEQRNKGVYIVDDGQPSPGGVTMAQVNTAIDDKLNAYTPPNPGWVTMNQVNTTIDDKLNAYTPLEVYSTTETRIGTWINGKPIYARTISRISPANTGWTMLEKVSNNIDEVISLLAMIKEEDTYHYWIQIPYASYSDGTGHRVEIGVRGGSDGRLGFYNSDLEWAISRPLLITCKYTKTTDQATVQSTFAMPASLTVESAAASTAKNKKVSI